MNDLKVIAHRGIRGPYIENSLAGFEAALKTRAVAVEFDVQATKDGQIVVLHSMSSPRKVFGITRPLNKLTWNEVQEYKSPAGETMPTFAEVMRALKNKSVRIDVKDIASARQLTKELADIPTDRIYDINSMHVDALRIINKALPNLRLSLHNYKHPFIAIRQAKQIGASHLTLPLYLVNPVTYLAARRAGLSLLIYQNYVAFLLDWRWFVRLLSLIYPGSVIFSNRADKVVPAKS